MDVNFLVCFYADDQQSTDAVDTPGALLPTSTSLLDVHNAKNKFDITHDSYITAQSHSTMDYLPYNFSLDQKPSDNSNLRTATPAQMRLEVDDDDADEMDDGDQAVDSKRIMSDHVRNITFSITRKISYPKESNETLPVLSQITSLRKEALMTQEEFMTEDTLKQEGTPKQEVTLKQEEVQKQEESLEQEETFVPSEQSGTSRHNIAPRKKCDICKEFVMNLSTHVRTHTGEKPFKCSVCGKSFAHGGTLTKHSRIHTGEKPYQCESCGVSFAYRHQLKDHGHMHADVPAYSCEICGKVFTRKYGLQMHSRLHTGEKPYQCEVCGKAFALSCNLIEHTRIHTGEKPYKCAVCGKSFCKSSDLTRHNRIHTGEKPYQCTVCGKTFADRGNLAQHARIHSPQHECKLCNKTFPTFNAQKNHQCVDYH